MVLGVLAFATTLSACGPTATPSPTVPEALRPDEGATVAGYTLTLTPRDRVCTVAFSGKERHGVLRLALTPPCRFVRRPDGPGVQSEFFADAAAATVVIVVGSPADDSEPQTADDFCGSRSQAVLLRPEDVRASSRVAKGRKCVTGEDPQEFWLFAH